MRALDANGDGMLDAKDAAFASLRVWVDANADGVSQAGELSSLAQQGIASLKVTATPATTFNNSNWLGLVSSYETVDGSTHLSADVWFISDRPAPALQANTSALAQAISSFAAPAAALPSASPLAAAMAQALAQPSAVTPASYEGVAPFAKPGQPLAEQPAVLALPTR